MIVELIIQGAGLGNEDFRTDLHFTDYIKGDKGDKGDALTFEDFTPEQIEVLQQPATEAAEESRKVSNEISDVEEKRATAEQNRVTAEGTRKDNEAKRVTTERTRVESEAGRIDKEKERVSAETSRVTSEQNRALAEDRRRQEHTAAIQESGAATTKADSAAEHATEVAAGIDGRMTEAETNLFQLRTVELPLKADLDPTTRTIPSAQIAPLHGLQTGVVCSTGYFKTSNPNLLFTTSKTYEFTVTISSGGLTHQENISRGDLILTCNIHGQISVYMGGVLISAFPVNPNSIYHIVVGYDAENKSGIVIVNGIKIITTSILTYSSVPVWIIGSDSVGANNFKGVINKTRLFNDAISDTEYKSLWNSGDPLNYMLSDDLRSKCVAEYLPCGLLSDKWRDTSGNGNDLAAVGTPQLTYERLAYAQAIKTKSITIDTPVLWNDTQCIVANDIVAKTNHGLNEDDAVEFDVLNGGVDPIPVNIRSTDDVWYVHKIDENNFQLYNKNRNPDTLITGLIQGRNWNFRRNSLDTIFTGIPIYKIKTVNITGRLIHAGTGGSPFISNTFNVPVFMNKSINDIVAKTTSYRAYSSGITGRVVDPNNKYIYNSTTFNIYYSPNLLVITSILYNSAKSDNIINTGSFSRSEAATSMYLSGDVTNIYNSDYGKCCIGSINKIGNGAQITIEYYE